MSVCMMATPTSDVDGSEDVNDFLRRVKELSSKRVEEDEARTRKLEEEILQGRKERQARRAERARSLSPSKSSPANTPPANRSTNFDSSSLYTDKFTELSPSPNRSYEVSHHASSSDETISQKAGVGYSEREKDTTLNLDSPDAGGAVTVNRRQGETSAENPAPFSSMPSRTPTLSWQQRRPTSQASDKTRSRPLSMVATENAAARSPRATPELDDSSISSRDQISQSLALKDPAWFRQTADRGTKSGAYRKNQVEEEKDKYSMPTSRMQLPGMTRDSVREPQKEPQHNMASSPPHNLKTTAPPLPDPSSESNDRGSRTSSNLGSSSLDITRLDSPKSDLISPGSNLQMASVRGLAMSPLQGRISPERVDRPISPTKGMGGFVQSAMMKRSDSVNKRWSVQSPPGIGRVNSVASNRSSREPTADSSSDVLPGSASSETRFSSVSRDSSPKPSSRPNSSHSNATITGNMAQHGTLGSAHSSRASTADDDGFVKPSLPALRSQNVLSGVSETARSRSASIIEKNVDASLPSSPSRTMDSRRWSPTKSSWLESALNKPDSPKPKPSFAPKQPAWMTEIGKAKQKGSTELQRGSTPVHKHEVKIGGLLRSPPPGDIRKPFGMGGLDTSSTIARNGQFERRQAQNVDKSENDESHEQASGDYQDRMDNTAISKQVPHSTASVKPAPYEKSLSSPSSSKAEIQPKKNFRSQLKPRQLSGDSGKTEEMEFKNVFGQLRHARTQNYVAPDPLKDNLLRGKAGLNVTGGPQKSEMKDEFKDAILKKKEAFAKAQSDGKGVTNQSTSRKSSSGPIPEAIMKKSSLGRNGGIGGVSALSTASSTSEPLPTVEPVRGNFEPTLSSRELPVPGIPQGKTSGGKLAERFNPSLISFLARGPPSMASETSQSTSLKSSQRTNNMSASATDPDNTSSSPQLTHMTKSRARGPKRKAPTSTATQSKASVSSQASSTTEGFAKADKTAKDAVELEPMSRNRSIRELTETIHSDHNSSVVGKLDLNRQSQHFDRGSTESREDRSMPIDTADPISVPTKVYSPQLLPKFGPQSLDTKLSTQPRSRTYKTHLKESSDNIVAEPSPMSASKATKTFESPGALRKNSLEVSGSNETDVNTGLINVKSAAAVWSKPVDSQLSPRMKSPIKLPTKADEEYASENAGLKSASVTTNLKATSDQIPKFSEQIVGQSSNGKSTGPLPRVSSSSVSSKAHIISPKPSSPVKANQTVGVPSSETSSLLEGFFGSHTTNSKYDVNTANLVSSKTGAGPKIKTTYVVLYQLSGGGRKLQVPSHQERVLFEGNMYLCLHTFDTIGYRKNTEVYLWVGNDVSEPEVEDAQIFAQREAKNTRGKMIMLRQGKECSEFIQAIGGIIIVRRGTSNRFDSLAPAMLCGRRHAGQIAFDEVDFSPLNLCSGFPHLITTKTRTSYLWKGRGSGVDEVSCARLIGMESSLTGEVEEIDDGKEPTTFLEIFGSGTKIPQSADHWRLKPSYGKYGVRLFISNSDIAHEKISEIYPFCQSDISPSHIYILDAFFEIYIIVGSRSQSQYAAFHRALLFAQEYGILAASMEDRPYVPVSTVVLEGIPRDLKRVFRSWNDDISPTITQNSVNGLTRGKSLRVVTLNAALDAMRY